MADYFTHRDKLRAVQAAEQDGTVVDSLDVRKALIERMDAGELTLDEVQAELKRIKKTGRTRAQVYRNA